jgi:hypothetical protein
VRLNRASVSPWYEEKVNVYEEKVTVLTQEQEVLKEENLAKDG